VNVEESSRSVTDICTGKRHDLASGLRLWLIFILPIIFLSLTGSVRTPLMDRALVPYLVVIWPVLLIFMGAACLYNARNCGRLHCYITGPFFLLLALVALLYGLGWLPFGSHGWKWLADMLVIGGIALTLVPEWLFGKYIQRDQKKNNSP
jgi:hypothetical protein